jgi:hydroxyethylthiazole kinase-like uncharacterized protein yjeF
MRRAGDAAAAHALDLLGDRRTGPVLVLAGPGNNGGDALEVAANLAAAGVDVDVVHLAGGVPAPDAAAALARARAGRVRFLDTIPDGRTYGLAVDGLFGIGLARPLAGRARELVDALNRLDCPVLALDVPSGLDADTGTVVGPDGAAVCATHTITFLGHKPGLHTGDGCDHAGRVRVERLGVDPGPDGAAQAWLSGPAAFAGQLRPRRRNTHKGSFGDVAVLGGARGMGGAAVLASRAALHAGAGRVFVAAVDGGIGLDHVQPEIMWRDANGNPAWARRTARPMRLGRRSMRAGRCWSTRTR